MRRKAISKRRAENHVQYKSNVDTRLGEEIEIF